MSIEKPLVISQHQEAENLIICVLNDSTISTTPKESVGYNRNDGVGCTDVVAQPRRCLDETDGINTQKEKDRMSETSMQPPKPVNPSNCYLVKQEVQINTDLSTFEAINKIRSKYQYFDLTDTLRSTFDFNGSRVVFSRKLLSSLIRDARATELKDHWRLVASSALSLWVYYAQSGGTEYELAVGDYKDGKPIARKVSVSMLQEGANFVVRLADEIPPKPAAEMISRRKNQRRFSEVVIL